MAWQNIYIPDITTELSSANLESNSAIELGNTYDIVSVNDLITIGTESVIYEKGAFKITVYATTTPGADYEPYHPTYKVYYNNNLLASTEGFDCDIVGLALGFDYSTKKAKLRAVQRRYSTYPPTTSSTRHTVSATSWSDSIQQSIYDALVSVGLITISGGAGSGYIGNSLLSNKKMVGYNVPTSSAESTKTESINEASESPVSGKPKIGNGFARIKFLSDVKSIDILPSVVENYYMSSYNCGPDDGLSHISSRCPDIIPYLETDKCICFGQTNKKALVSESSMFKYENTRDTSGSMELIPIGTKCVKRISFKYQKPYSNNPEWNHFVLQLVNISNDGTLNEAITVVSDKDSTVSQEWHNISYTCDAEITHIATTGVQSTWYMKDLQITYVDD